MLRSALFSSYAMSSQGTSFKLETCLIVYGIYTTSSMFSPYTTRQRVRSCQGSGFRISSKESAGQLPHTPFSGCIHTGIMIGQIPHLSTFYTNCFNKSAHIFSVSFLHIHFGRTAECNSSPTFIHESTICVFQKTDHDSTIQILTIKISHDSGIKPLSYVSASRIISTVFFLGAPVIEPAGRSSKNNDPNFS